MKLISLVVFSGNILFALTTPVRTEATELSAAVLINFQPGNASVPTGYLPDSGAVFSSARGYGWTGIGILNGLFGETGKYLRPRWGGNLWTPAR